MQALTKQPSHIVLATFGSLGDLHPFLGLGLALQARGHRVTIATHECYRSRIPSALGFAPLRPDLPADPAFHARFMNPNDGAKFVIRDYLAPAIEDTYNDLSAACADANLLVSQSLVMAAPLVARAQPIKWLSAVFQPFPLYSAYDPSALPLPLQHGGKPWQVAFNRYLLNCARQWTSRWLQPIVKLRERLRIPAYGQPLFEGQFAPHGTLALFPTVFGMPQPDWPPQTVQTGFIPYQPAKSVQPALQTFLEQGQPPLIFTLGSASVRKPSAFFEMAVQIARQLGQRALLIGDSATTPLPDGMLRVAYADYKTVFPHAAAIVHSGGIGTCIAALQAGKPQLIVPFAHDQLDNARRLNRGGYAAVLPFKRLNQQRLTTALTNLLSALLQSLAPGLLQDGTEAAVARIETVLAT